MRHQNTQERQRGKIKMLIATIIGLINKGDIKQAINVAMQHGITDRQFGIITRYASITNTANISENVKKIYKELCL